MRKVALSGLFVAGVQLHGNAAEPAKCEAELKADHYSLLPLKPPRTEYDPRGSVIIEFTVNPDGTVSDVVFTDWNIVPSDEFMRGYLRQSVNAWRFPRRVTACRGQQKITIELGEDA